MAVEVRIETIMKAYKITELVELAKEHSLFYRDLYKDLPHFSGNLADLPLLHEEEYWKANSFHDSHIITDSKEGIVIRTGGTAGHPKTSIFSNDEWIALCQITVDKLTQEGLLKEGDRIANMFASGNLYGSFLLVSEMLKLSRSPVLELPIGTGKTLNIQDEVALLKELEANVVMGTPYLLISLVTFIKSHKIKGLKLDRFLYGADLLLESQYLFIKELFPEAIITSSGYASSDAGFLGYADKGCEINEYRTDSALTILEIIDPTTKKPIEEANKPGILVATNLTKILVPIIRYPVGDMAMWIEPKGAKNRKVKLMGRVRKKENLIELDGKEYDFQDFYEMLKKSEFFLKILGFQIEKEKNGKILFRIALENEQNAKEEIKKTIVEALSPEVKSKIDVEIIKISDVKFNSATYKAIKVLK